MGSNKDKSVESTDTYFRRNPGKRVVFMGGLICVCIAMVSLVAAFITPYWIISWPRVYTPFKYMGLWEACFAGLVLPTDPDQVSYHGCWWILSPMYQDIRSWIMPGWVIYCQVICTLCFFAEIVNVVFHGWLWCRTGGDDALKDGKYLFKIQTAAIITVVTGLLMVSVTLVFAIGWYLDRMWLPNPQFNYLYGSYGMAVISAFFSIFASIMEITYVMIVRQEMREPPRSVPLSGYVPGSSKINLDISTLK